MAVYAMHGIFSDGDAKAFQNRCLIREDKFDRLLSSLPFKFVSLDDAIAGRGEALTVDDATNAAYRAAMLARGRGHAVSVFVNPYFVHSQRAYFFLELNWLLDRTERSSIEFEGTTFPLSLRSERRTFRIHVKDKYCMLASVEEIESAMGEIGAGLGVERDGLPGHLRTMTERQLRTLINAGVCIHNHGFAHIHPKALRWPQLMREIALAHEWIRDVCGQESRHFAVPFGDSLPQWSLPKERGLNWFTLHDEVEGGALGPGIWNRLPVEALLENLNEPCR
jgi:hypothetical protein